MMITMSMACPHCGVSFIIQKSEKIGILKHQSYISNIKRLFGYEIEVFLCLDCKELIVILKEGRVDFVADKYIVNTSDRHTETFIYPSSSKGFDISQIVPEKYRNDFNQAAQILQISPKASAAMSRTMLQTILREEYGINKRDLYLEIEEFVSKKDVPSYIAESVDAIRIVGNLAAHPQKSKQTGEIMEVEDGEAEWLLEVLEALFDFTFVQPVKLIERKEKLNEKLKELGKKEMLLKNI